MDVHRPLLALEARATSGPLDEGVHRAQLRVQVVARDVEAGLDDLGRHEDAGPRGAPAEQLADTGLLRSPVLGEEPRMEQDQRDLRPGRHQPSPERLEHRLGPPDDIQQDDRAATYTGPGCLPHAITRAPPVIGLDHRLR